MAVEEYRDKNLVFRKLKAKPENKVCECPASQLFVSLSSLSEVKFFTYIVSAEFGLKCFIYISSAEKKPNVCL
jgi:hypothetical protein